MKGRLELKLAGHKPSPVQKPDSKKSSYVVLLLSIFKLLKVLTR